SASVSAAALLDAYSVLSDGELSPAAPACPCALLPADVVVPACEALGNAGPRKVWPLSCDSSSRADNTGVVVSSVGREPELESGNDPVMDRSCRSSSGSKTSP